MVKDSAFIHYMESGLWYVFLFNDGVKPQKIAFVGSQYGKFYQFIATLCTDAN